MTQRYLVQTETGRKFAYCPMLARRHDMISVKGEAAADHMAKLQADTEDEYIGGDGEFVISKATKAELVKFAAEELELKLDQTKKVGELRAEVMEAVEAAEATE